MTLSALLALAAACTPTVDGPGGGPPSPRVVAPTLVVTDSSVVNGSSVVTLTLRLDGLSPTLGKVGSFTGRVSYDPAALSFVEEVALGDGVLRAINPQPGTVRVAGAAAAGMSPDALIALRFAVKTPAGAGTARASIDELHGVSRADFSTRLRENGGVQP